MKSTFIKTLLVGIVSLATLQGAFAVPKGGDDHDRGRDRGRAFNDCEWRVETADREVTAECRGDSFVVSGGCNLDEGSFRGGFPTNVENGDSIFRGDGWRCETTANQPITAYALCCSD